MLGEQPIGIAQQNRSVRRAEFTNALSAPPARRAWRAIWPRDGNGSDALCPCRDHHADGICLGALALWKGGVLDIAARMDAARLIDDRGADGKR